MAGGQAFKAERGTVFFFDPDDLVIIGLDTKPTESEPVDRRIDLPLNPARVKNVRAHGVLEPVIVTKDDKGRAVVVDGRQRVRWAREANRQIEAENEKDGGKRALVRVPAVQRKGSPRDLFGITISANEHRENDPPSATAEKIEQFISYGHTEEEAATESGRTLNEVRALRALLDLSAPTRRLVDSGNVSVTAAAKLAGKTADEQAAALATVTEGGKKASVRRMANVAAGKRPELRPPTRKQIQKVRDGFQAIEAKNDTACQYTNLLDWIITGKTTKQIRALLGETETETEST